MEIAGKITSNKKRYGKYVYSGKTREISFGGKRKEPALSLPEVSHEEATGLNDLDSGIMGNFFEDNIKKDSLRLEMRLERAEKKLEKVREEIKISRTLSINTPEDNERLEKAQKRLEKEIASRRREYRDMGLSYRVVDSINQASRAIREKAHKALEFSGKFLPSAGERGKLNFAKMLDKRIARELRRPDNSRPRRIEPLLFRAERL